MRTLAILAALAVALAATPAAACSCYPSSRAEIVARADIVFEGTVAVVARTPRGLQATIDVSRVEKGPALRAITLTTPPNPALCGVNFRIAQRVVVAAARRGRIWETNQCMSLGLKPPLIPRR